jgi:spiro-SPASM protein
MNVIAILYGGELAPCALEKRFSGQSAFERALAAAASFEGVTKTSVLLGEENADAAEMARERNCGVVVRPKWETSALLTALATEAAGFDYAYFAWADSPFLDKDLAVALLNRAVKYRAEYAYADGFAYGLAPELLAPGVAGILAKIAENNTALAETSVARDTVFRVLSTDINSFDIETEISRVDLREKRLRLAADSKRDLLLCASLWEAGLDKAEAPARAVEDVVAQNPALLRTLPAFFSLQVTGDCPADAPQKCGLCPLAVKKIGYATLTIADFSRLLDNIAAFAGDGVIDLSLWGEIACRNDRAALVKAVLERPALACVVETAALAADLWTEDDLVGIAGAMAAAPATQVPSLPSGAGRLSWIVSDSGSPPDASGAYTAFVSRLAELFPGNVYVQMLRVKGNEDDAERFYRNWTASKWQGKVKVIIQKYDSFAGLLPDRIAADISPIERNPCWHLMRDMYILADGTVWPCRAATLNHDLPSSGNAFIEPLDKIWKNGEELYMRHAVNKELAMLCGKCDEYYTFNF